MEEKRAEEIISQATERIGKEQKAMKAFSDMAGSLFDEKKGAIASVKDTYEKIDGVPVNYAMQLAFGLKKFISETLPKLYQDARKFAPKSIREALKTIIKYKVDLPAALAKDAYNKRALSKKYQMEAKEAVGQMNSVRYGI